MPNRKPLTQKQRDEINHVLVGGIISLAGLITTMGAQLVLILKDGGQRQPLPGDQRKLGPRGRKASKRLTARKGKGYANGKKPLPKPVTVAVPIGPSPVPILQPPPEVP